jgi:hypothetical protein
MANGAHRQRTARPAALSLATAGVIGLTLLAAGCGSSSGAKVAQVGTTNSASGPGTSNTPGSGDLKAYSACMRSHHVPNFPDPGADGSIHLARRSIRAHRPTRRRPARAVHSLRGARSPNRQSRKYKGRCSRSRRACAHTASTRSPTRCSLTATFNSNPITSTYTRPSSPPPRRPASASCLRSTRGTSQSSSPRVRAENPAGNDRSCALVLFDHARASAPLGRATRPSKTTESAA